MIFNRNHFPIFFLLVALTICSCTDTLATKTNLNYTDFTTKGLDFFNKKRLDSAFFYFNKAQLSCSTSEKDRKSYALYYMAEIQRLNCDFAGTEDTATQIVKINPNYSDINTIYNILGLAYKEQLDFDNAIKYFNETLKISKSELQKCIVKNNIGYVYLATNNYKSAIRILEPLIKNDALLADKSNCAKVLDNLGYAYYKLNKPEGIKYLNQSLQIRKTVHDDSELIASYIHLAEYYQGSNSKLSLEFANKAYSCATTINSPDDRIAALKLQIIGSDFQDGKKLALQQMEISDSINKVRQSAKNQFAKIKFDAKTAIEETKVQKNQKIVYLILLLTAVITGLLSYFLIRSKNRAKVIETSYKTETRISKKLHDELANDVYNAMMYAETKDLSNLENKETLLQNLDTIYLRTRNIAKENSDIDTSEQFLEHFNTMISSYSNKEISEITKTTMAINWKKVKSENKIAIFRVIQELLVNMKKHSRATIVIIGFDTINDTLQIDYSDNGIGTSETLKLKNGLRNAENRIKDSHGTITFETSTSKGFRAKIKIPK